jgi:hypothetical protein
MLTNNRLPLPAVRKASLLSFICGLLSWLLFAFLLFSFDELYAVCGGFSSKVSGRDECIVLLEGGIILLSLLLLLSSFIASLAALIRFRNGSIGTTVLSLLGMLFAASLAILCYLLMVAFRDV